MIYIWVTRVKRHFVCHPIMHSRAKCVKSVPFKTWMSLMIHQKLWKSPVKFIIIHISTANWSIIYLKLRDLFCNIVRVNYIYCCAWFFPTCIKCCNLMHFKINTACTNYDQSLWCTIFLPGEWGDFANNLLSRSLYSSINQKHQLCL